MKSTFARRISILLVLAMVLAMLPVAAFAADAPATLYLQPNENWLKDGARFAAYFFGNGETWVNMTDADADGVYEVAVPAGYPNVIFCRMNPKASANNWSNKWNQTSDLVVPTNGTNLYIVKPGTWDKGAGTWDTFTPGDEVTEATTVPNAYKYYAAGDFNTWNECNDDYGLTLVDGVYTLTLELAAGTYTFKITDGTWTNSWGLNGTDSNYEFVLDADATVVITFDDTTKVPAVTSNAMGEVTIYDYYLAGEMNGWTVNSSSMGLTANGDGTYSITIDMVAGTYAYKFTNGTWDVCFPAGMDNASITVAADCAVTFTLNPADGSYTATGEGVGEPETPVVPPVTDITAVNVKGTIPGIDWDADSTTGAMELVDGIYTVTFSAVPASEVGAAAYAFKVMVNNSWDTAYPESDWTFYLNATCDVTITFNPATNECAIFADGLTYDAPVDPEGGEDPVDPPVTEDVFNVKGNVAGLDWDLTSGTGLMTKNEDGSYSLTIAGVAAATKYSIKVVKNNSWDFAIGGEGAGGNYEFAVTDVCDVTITVAADGTLSVSGEFVTAAGLAEIVIDSVCVAGSGDESGNGFLYGVNWDPASSVNQMTLENGVYTITYTGVAAGTYEFKFALNGGWTYSYASGVEVVSGETTTAWYNPLGNSTLVVAADNSTVTLVLDLSAVKYEMDNAQMTVTIEESASIKENAAPEQIVIGNNDFAFATGNREPVTAPYTATFTGTLYIYPTAMTVVDNWSGTLQEVPSSAINMQFGRMYGIVVDGMNIWGNEIEVVEGQTYQIGIMDNMGSGCLVTLTVCDGHQFVDGVCSTCGYVCEYHNWDNGLCLNCGAVCNHEVWDGGWCTNCWAECENHKFVYTYSTSAHTFACAGQCGQSFSIENTDGLTFKINSAAPVLGEDIALNYRVTLPAGFEDAYMIFELNGEFSYAWGWESTYDAEKDQYVFLCPGINPLTIGDNVCATLYAYVNGVEVSVQIPQYSVLKYCDNQLKKTTISAELRTILSDVLVYGAKAQVYSNYLDNGLVTERVTDPNSLTPSTFTALDDSYNLQKVIGTKDTEIDYKNAALSLGSKVIVKYGIICANLEAGYVFKIEVAGEEYTYTTEDLISDENGNLYLEFDKLRAVQLGEKITATIWDGDTQVGRTIEYSVYTYIYRNQNTSDVAMRELLEAIYNYGESAKNA